MNQVEPIRDLSKVQVMKELMLADGKEREAFLLILGVNTGLRISDLLKVTWGQVLAGVFYVHEQKTGKARKITLNKITQETLKELEQGAPDDFVFKSESNRVGGRQQPWEQTYPRKILKHYAQLAGVPENVGTHSLRKTFGYALYKAGHRVEYIQKILNHSTPEITLRYIGIEQEHLDQMVMELSLGA